MPFSGIAPLTMKKCKGRLYLYRCLFDTIFNMDYGSVKSPIGYRVKGFNSKKIFEQICKKKIFHEFYITFKNIFYLKI